MGQEGLCPEEGRDLTLNPPTGSWQAGSYPWGPRGRSPPTSSSWVKSQEGAFLEEGAHAVVFAFSAGSGPENVPGL